MVSLDKDGYESDDAQVMSSFKTKEGWVMDPCCSYQMCPRKKYFETLKLKHNV